MIGFLKKDVYCLASLYKKNLVLVYVLYAVLTIATDNLFFLYFMIWLMGFYAISAISLDNSCGWDRFARTLPATMGNAILSAGPIVNSSGISSSFWGAGGASISILPVTSLPIFLGDRW